MPGHDLQSVAIIARGKLTIPIANYAAGAALNTFDIVSSHIAATSIVQLTPTSEFGGDIADLGLFVVCAAGKATLTFDDINVTTAATFDYVIFEN